MDSFLDTCVIINFIQYKEFDNEIKRKCYDYVESNIEGIIICSYVHDEIKMFIRKMEVQLNEVIHKKEDKNYQIGESKESAILRKEDLLFAEKLYEKIKSEETGVVKSKLIELVRLIRFNFNIFVNNIKETLKEDIDKSLVNLLREFIEDYADCKVLASALKAQQKREIFIFVTADKHITSNIYNFIKQDRRLEKYKFPILKNFSY